MSRMQRNAAGAQEGVNLRWRQRIERGRYGGGNMGPGGGGSGSGGGGNLPPGGGTGGGGSGGGSGSISNQPPGGFRGRRVTTCSFCGKTSREVGPDGRRAERRLHLRQLRRPVPEHHPPGEAQAHRQPAAVQHDPQRRGRSRNSSTSTSSARTTPRRRSRSRCTITTSG